MADLLDVSDDDCRNKLRMDRKRSGQTVSQEFHSVLRSVLKLHFVLLVKPLPVPDDSNDPRWGKFKTDPQVKGSRYKTWPYYASWTEIFGKDRANGENAVDPIDLVNDLQNSAVQEQGGDTEENHIPSKPTGVNEA
ncbi:hypothetical protein ACS0TY_001539 [Phlomoides rotata]